MKRILLSIAFVLIGSSAYAATCTCSSTCNFTASTNWSCGSIPGTADDAICASGCTLSINTTPITLNYLWVKPGGAATVTVSPVVLNFNGPTFQFPGTTRDTFFAVGNTGDDRGTFTSSGKDLTINWQGASTAAMVLGPSGNGSGTDLTSTNFTAVTLRGVERADTNVKAYSRGAAAPTPDTDMVDCVDGVAAPTSGAISDTIVFTTGKSQDFWYEVTAYPANCTGVGTANAGFPGTGCTGAGATTECSAVACGGGPCDYEITRNSTGSSAGSVASSNSWDSMTLATQDAPFGAGGAALHATPMDSDADGVANGDGLLPSVGDKFVVFKPVLIQGGTNPITNGMTFWAWTGGLDLRYVELNKVSGEFSEDCDAALADGDPAMWDFGSRVLSPEGAWEFVNVHNFASRQSLLESSYTDDPDDAKSNEPRTYKHWYMHDVDATVGTTCPGEGVTTAGRALVFGIDDAARTQTNIKFYGLHIARWGSHSAIDLTDMGGMGSRRGDIQFYDTILHDFPGIAAYGQLGKAISVGESTQTVFHGLSMWDLGNNTVGASGFESSRGVEPTLGTIVTFRADNVFAVNIDSNAQFWFAGGPSIGGFMITSDSGVYGSTTRGSTVSNSYIANIVGGAALGGNLLNSFVKNVDLEEDATAPCTNSAQRSAIESPVSAIGNVITRSNALSCMSFAFGDTVNHASALTDVTRRIISNVAFNMDNDASVIIGGMYMRDSATNHTRNIDLYNNVFDLRSNTGNGIDSCFLLQGDYDGTLTAYYNICMNAIGGNSYGWDFGTFGTSGTLDEGYNRFVNINAADPVFIYSPDRTMASTDVDSDKNDVLADPWNNVYSQLCESSDKTRGPLGVPVGPLAFGIKSFNHFHPAVIPLMDTDAFKMRYDWRNCGAAAQDILPWNKFSRPTLAQTYLGGASYTGTIFGSSTNTVTTTSTTITIPGAASNRFLNGIRVTAPSTNTDVVYLYDGTTATSSHMPIYPGTTHELPFRNLTVAALAASGSQTLIVVGLYQEVP